MQRLYYYISLNLESSQINVKEQIIKTDLDKHLSKKINDSKIT